MKKLLTFIYAIVLLSTLNSAAHAYYIVDTGVPTGNTHFFLDNDSSVNGRFQQLAGQFTTTENVTITSIEGYIDVSENPYEVKDGMIYAVLYLDNLGALDPIGELSATAFSIPAGTHFNYDWRGVFGLEYYLTAGTYWVAFEARDDQSAFSYMRSGVPNPLNKYAFNYGSGWEEHNFSIGIRINARDNQSHAVPEPASMVLLGSGLMGMGFLRKRKA